MRRLFWWIVAYERPTWVGDYLAILTLVLLLLLGALALSWSWLSEEVPRALAARLAGAQEAVAAWARHVAASLRLG
jgi:hypothetical protein